MAGEVDADEEPRRRFRLPLDFGEGPRLQRASGRFLPGGALAEPGAPVVRRHPRSPKGNKPKRAPTPVWEIAMQEREGGAGGS